MKRSATLSMTLITLIALTAALLLVGCGQNRAEAPAETPAPAIDIEPAAEAKPDPQLVAREQELERLQERLADLEREIDARAETLRVLEEPAPAEPVLDEPDLEEPFVDGPAEPVLQTVWVAGPETMPLDVEILDPLSSETSLIGDRFVARLADDIVQNGIVAVPAGATLFGTVTDVNALKRIGGQARLQLSFDELETADGNAVPILASVELLGKRQTNKDTATIGGSAAGGAILGRVLSDDKDKGTVLGAVLGAAIGTAVASRNEGDPVIVEPGQIARLELVSPFEVAVVRSLADPRFARAN